ncbi:Mis12 protein-domain-containing protein [Dipodascopsis tothii]|uniref:Mis12 protein-domain-containing protein n=1 Tax=Dipodascopsis tothii TaxID=44089 RepID=UPI0034CDB50F
MPPPTSATTALLTEHLSYPPIALLDDIINAVNTILYKCTAAIETYLQTQPPCPNIPPEEIELGTAKLESLLEDAVDRNFDRFELYVLRNILAIPEEVTDGWFRLEHHKGIDFSGSSDMLDARLLTLRKTLQSATYVHDKLQQQVESNRRFISMLEVYSKALSFLTETSGVSPMNETVRYFVAQLGEIQARYARVQEAWTAAQAAGPADGERGEVDRATERELYIEKMTAVIVGMAEESGIDVDREYRSERDVENARQAAAVVAQW